MTTEEAIDSIVTYNTLPSQIDYTRPYRIRSRGAEEYLETLEDSERNKAYDEIEKRIEAYYTENEDGISPADMAELF